MPWMSVNLKYDDGGLISDWKRSVIRPRSTRTSPTEQALWRSWLVDGSEGQPGSEGSPFMTLRSRVSESI